ncbi:HD domain-containing phosphohydrolase [Aliidiomarina haloalkalitolerans]|uniref:HD-GYP domain-containing protein n=1 Tax=Aliidiomarina haloalkalitolerans TaxID=859059 RepID=A0A432VW37_9GAMM|nr:HD domain-containing phosphohydrolase [Aliidiomarina haloalkalitolerans]RUO20778.1 hypothetical protein CWE06_05605 [Aliidiomarina haloalkalitolerans]
MQEEEYSPVSSKLEVAALLETMTQPGAATLQLTTAEAKPYPVILLDLEEDEFVEFDLTAIRELAPKLRRGVKFVLLGQTHAGLIRSTPMHMETFTDKDGRLLARSAWPEGLDLKQRRAAFRATLRIGMDVGVRLRAEEPKRDRVKASSPEAVAAKKKVERPAIDNTKKLEEANAEKNKALAAGEADKITAQTESASEIEKQKVEKDATQEQAATDQADQKANEQTGKEDKATNPEKAEEEKKYFELMGDLKDLSATGCLVEFFAQDGASKVITQMRTELEVCFPNGTVFPIVSDVRHVKTDSDRQVLSVGFEFFAPTKEQEKQLWEYVREIEREASRTAGEGNDRTPSPLFEVKEDAVKFLGRRQGQKYATPMARRLARIAGYLDSQMVALTQGQKMNSGQLSAHADRLLDIIADDREEALFALRCIHRESPWVVHGLSVAVKLVDLAQSRGRMPRDVIKGIAACAMIHDLGKGMLPGSLWRASTLTRDSYMRMQSHVELILAQMDTCKWLAPILVTNIIEQINERLDGSGYPNELVARDLGQLPRMAAVVDAIDAMSRPRADREGMTAESTYRHLLQNQNLFDVDWIEAYIRHFGVIPIGSLIQFESGQLAWVTRLDDQRHIKAVVLTSDTQPPQDNLGDTVEGTALEKLGEIKAVLGVDY